MNVNPTYDIGSPKLKDLWVDPLHGRDDQTGLSRSQAFRSLARAWEAIPSGCGEHGFRILLCLGRHHADESGQIRLANRLGSLACPIVLAPADGPLTAELPQLDVRGCDFFYLLDVKLVSASRMEGDMKSTDNVLHFSDCRDVLVRGVTAVGLDKPALPYNVLKANQCLRLYIEDCDLSGAVSNSIDYVAVHYGHIVRNRLHRTKSECMYVKGGSAYHLIAGNEVYDAPNHGIMAGQCTGFQYMVSPWLHYEAYGIRVVNNVVHHCGGGLAVGGGYNILMAHNTCYQVGDNRDTVVVGMGGRGHGPGGWMDRLDRYHSAGGWCNPDGEGAFNIPCRNVQIVNNVILNPDGFESRFAHFGISGPVATQPGSNLPSRVEIENLRIEGNVIWNGGLGKPVLDDVENEYHLASRPTADAAVLARLNTINTLRPDLIDPAGGDFRPMPGGQLAKVRGVPIREFDWSDAPKQPAVPAGDGDNAVPTDRAGSLRKDRPTAGAYECEAPPHSTGESRFGTSP